jgi:hypothetical protein
MEDTSKHTLRNLVFILSILVIVVSGYYAFQKYGNKLFKKEPEFTKFSAYAVKFENNIITVKGVPKADLIDNKMYKPKEVEVIVSPDTKFIRIQNTLKVTSVVASSSPKIYTQKREVVTVQDFINTLNNEKNIPIYIVTSSGPVSRSRLNAEEVSYVSTK